MSDAGVVDPIRLPAPVERFIGETPRLALVFIALAVVDVVGRSIGVIAPRIDYSLASPLTFLADVLGHDLWILVPAVILIRRADALERTPLIVGGAVILAIVELVKTPLRFLIGDDAGGAFGLSISVEVAASILMGAAWLAIARGLDALNPQRPSPFATGLANLVAIGVLIPIAIRIIDQLTRPTVDVFGDPARSQAVTLANLFGLVAVVGLAYALRMVVRGLDDERRPRQAILAGVAAAAATATVGLIEALIGIVVIIDRPTAQGFDSALYVVVGWIGIAGLVGLVVAFGLGLADPVATRDTAEA